MLASPLRMDSARIFIGIGGNLPSARFGQPPESFAAALEMLAARGITIYRVSRWYRSAPLPPSAQPYYINGVIEARSALSPGGVLAACHQVEGEFGRVRAEMNAARCLDLDVLAYGTVTMDAGDGGGGTVVPHPRVAERAFVLMPWAELAADWRHPVSGRTVSDMLAALAQAQDIELLCQREARR